MLWAVGFYSDGGLEYDKASRALAGSSGELAQHWQTVSQGPGVPAGSAMALEQGAGACTSGGTGRVLDTAGGVDGALQVDTASEPASHGAGAPNSFDLPHWESDAQLEACPPQAGSWMAAAGASGPGPLWPPFGGFSKLGTCRTSRVPSSWFGNLALSPGPEPVTVLSLTSPSGFSHCQ
jgi:hypothetical protein